MAILRSKLILNLVQSRIWKGRVLDSTGGAHTSLSCMVLTEDIDNYWRVDRDTAQSEDHSLRCRRGGDKGTESMSWNQVSNPFSGCSLVLSCWSAHIQEITQNRTRFVKPIELYGTLEFFGRNIVVSEGDEWKKYRKIAAPAFSEVRHGSSEITHVWCWSDQPSRRTQSNNKLVWDETIKLCDELFTDVWEGKDEVTVDHCVEFTLPVRLCSKQSLNALADEHDQARSLPDRHRGCAFPVKFVPLPILKVSSIHRLRHAHGMVGQRWEAEWAPVDGQGSPPQCCTRHLLQTVTTRLDLGTHGAYTCN